jgi:hypothetical protein
MPARLDQIKVSCFVDGAWLFAGAVAGVLAAGIKESVKELPLGEILGGVVAVLAKQVREKYTDPATLPVAICLG